MATSPPPSPRGALQGLALASHLSIVNTVYSDSEVGTENFSHINNVRWFVTTKNGRWLYIYKIALNRVAVICIQKLASPGKHIIVSCAYKDKKDIISI